MDLQKEVELIEERTKREKSFINNFLAKEFFDRIGYGFGSTQFINILFSQIGAPFYLIALINGIKAIISAFGSSIIQKYSEVSTLSKKFIGRFGILFGLSFLFLAIARFYHSKTLFVIAFLIGGVSIVSHGDLYTTLLNKTLRKERRGYLLRTITTNGLIITMVSLLIAAFIMNKFPETGTILKIFGKNFRVYGYFIVFEVTAIAFILSGYIMSLIKENKIIPKKIEFFKSYKHTIKTYSKQLLQNKTVLTLLIVSTVVSAFQVISNSFYGIFIFNHFRYIAFGGFVNVAMIFLLAVIGSLFGPVIAKMLSRKYGKKPMLVFGTLLTAIMPLTFYYNPNLLNISMGVITGVIGSAITGLAVGMFVIEKTREHERKDFFATFNLLAVIPFVILVPILSFVVQKFGLKILFLVNGLILALIIAPVYFIFLFKQ